MIPGLHEARIAIYGGLELALSIVVPCALKVRDADFVVACRVVGVDVAGILPGLERLVGPICLLVGVTKLVAYRDVVGVKSCNAFKLASGVQRVAVVPIPIY